MIGKTDLNSELVGIRLTDALVQYDDQLQIQPLLAERWEFSDDRRQLTFHLRRDVRWHDGQPVTSADVRFTYEMLLRPETENRTWAPELRKVTRLETPDDHTVIAHYDAMTPDVLDSWRAPVLPAHHFPEGDDFFTGSFAQHPIGNGPFRFVHYIDGQELVLEANDDYWGGRPEIDRLIFKIYADQQTAYQALLTGDLDIMTMSGNLWDQLQENDAKERLTMTQFKRYSTWTLGWKQHAGEVLEDPRVRIAMIHALDRETFIDEVVRGAAHIGATIYPPSSAWASPNVTPYPFDPDRARQLLDEAGWTDSDGDGVRDKDGTPLAFTLLTPQSSQQLTEWMAVWQQQSWGDVGADVTIEMPEWQTFRERRKAGQFGVAAQTFHFTGPDMTALLHSGEPGALNYWGIQDPALDAALEEVQATFDPAERIAAMERVQQILHESEYITSLFCFNSPLAYDRRLAGVSTSPLGFMNTMNGPRNWSWQATAD